MAFFCPNPNSNQWVTSGCSAVVPTPNPPAKYPAFDASKNTWITSGNYGVATPATIPYFSANQNKWVSS